MALMACEQIENMIILTDNHAVDEWTLSASSAAANHPVTELQNESVKLTWKSVPSAAPQWIEGISSGSGPPDDSRYIDSIAIINHFVNSTNPDIATVNLQMWEIGGAPVFNQTFSLKNYGAPISTAGIVDEILAYKTRVIHIPLQTPIQHRWRLTFTDPVATGATYFEIGRLFLTKRFQPSDNFEYDSAIISDDTSRISQSDGKDISTDFDPQSRIFEMIPPVIKTKTDLPEWARLVFLTGKRRSVFVDMHPRYPDSNFGVNDDYEMIFNKLGQLYGNFFSPLGISRSSGNITNIKGRMSLVESLG